MSQTFTQLAITFIFSLSITHSHAQTPQQTQNTITFTKCYGYIKYFHPSDEAASINWDKLAVYGNERVSQCKTNEELKKALEDIFMPFAPTLQLLNENDPSNFDIKKITPPKTKGYEVIAWQHYGVQSEFKNSIYKSARTNRPYTNASNGSVDKNHKRLFKEYPLPGEFLEKKIGSGLKVILPISLYGTDTQTFPSADESAFNALKEKLVAIPDSLISGDRLYTRLGALSVCWNVFQHFYPYFDVIKPDWDGLLKQAIERAYTDKTKYNFRLTLQLFTAPLKDGHISVYGLKRTYFLPLNWEWVENELVITKVTDSSLAISKGDIVKRIDGLDAKKYFDSINSTISAGTQGWLRYRAQVEAIMGDSESVKLDILRNGITPETISVPRQTYKQALFTDQPQLASIREYPNDIMYINIRTASLDSIKKSLTKLQKSRVIICDLRVYPNNNHQVLNYLLKEKDTSGRWMQVAHTIYPDRERIPNWTPMGWNLQPLKPHLDAKIIFITDGSAISYAESFMSFVEHYKLATIVGQPTAGANGNVNELSLPGGYRIRYTGMKVQKHDGSVHHGVGILPNVYVEKTVKGVREGKDELLEKALELVK